MTNSDRTTAVQQTPDGDPLLKNQIFFVMARASAFGNYDANKALKPLGLKVRHYSALTLTTSSVETAPTQRQIAEYLALDPSQVVGIVDWLESHDLVQRHPDPKDRRSKVVVTTKKGLTTLKEAHILADGAASKTLSALDPDERAVLHRLLSKVAFAS